MICSACRVAYPAAYVWCPRCGAALSSALHDAAWDDADEVIEGTVVAYEATGGDLPADSVNNGSDDHRPTIAQATPPSTSLVVARSALPSLPARLWRQPAVRAVAQAGAGALALSLGMRLLRGALARPGARGQLAGSALPVLRQMFDSRATARRSPLSAASSDDAEIVETFVYMRRIVRRR